MVSDAELPHVSGLYTYRTQRQFTKDVEFFVSRYTPVAVEDLLRYLEGYGSMPRRSVLFTFDDGFREVYDIIYPILFKKGIPAVFFPIAAAIDNCELCYPQKKSLIVMALRSLKDSSTIREISLRLDRAGTTGDDFVTQIQKIPYQKRHLLNELGSILGIDFDSYLAAVKPYLTSDQISELIKKGFVFGGHSVDHPRYTELSLKEQLWQTKESIEFISKKFGCDCNVFAFPFTDSGISAEFFRSVSSAKLLKASFGIGGLTKSNIPRHFPRFSMERTDLPAVMILARQFGRALFRRDVRNMPRI